MEIFQLANLAPPGVKLALNFQTWVRESSSGLHRHDAVEVIFVTAGCGVNAIDAVQYPIIAGDLYVIAPGSTHSFYSGSTLQFYNLLFRFEDFPPEELAVWQNNRPLFDFFAARGKLHLPPPQAEGVARYFALIEHELKLRRAGWELNARAGLTLLLNEIGRAAAAPLLPAALPTGHDPHAILVQMLESINRDYLKPGFSLTRLAARVHRSPNYISELFREQTGIGVTRYLHTLRLEYARRLLLEQPERSIAEIAVGCGFADPGYFARRFHQFIGCAPLAYRKRHGRTIRKSS